MRIFSRIWFRLRSVFRPHAINDEFDEELRFHIDRETSENIKRGMSADEARRVALAEFGGVSRFREEVRDQHGVRWLDDLSADVRHGVRLLRMNMLFSGAVIGTLALGIGATSTIFAVVNGVLLRPLPFPEPDRIVSIGEVSATSRLFENARIGQRAYEVWSPAAHSFSAMALYSPTSATLTGEGEPVDVEGAQTTASFFSVLSTRVAFGRPFTPAENVPGSERVIVLSQNMWKNTFGGDSAVLNRTIMMNGNATTVIGVMPPDFAMPSTAQYWVALRIPDVPEAEFSFDMIARLRDGISPESALRELKSLAVRVDSLRSATNRGNVPTVITLHDRLFGSVQKPLIILLGAVVVLLLIACANVANLTLARSAARQREFAVRLALGAGRWRLVRQLLVESSILAGIGGALGLLVPLGLVGVFVKLSPSSVAGVSDIRVDGAVMLFTAATTVIAALLFGLAPALTGSRSDSSSTLAAGNSRGGSTRAHRTVRSALVVFEVSAALTLLTGAGLLTKSFVNATAVNPGFTAKNVYAATVQLPGKRYPNAEAELSFFDQLRTKVGALPGVEVVSVSRTKPLGGFSFTNEMARSPEDPVKLQIAFAEIDGNYGKAVGLRLISGRFIDNTDVFGAPPVVMLTKSAAQHFFPGVDAVGRVMPRGGSFVDAGASPPTVIGVVEDVAQRSLDVAPLPQVFLSGPQRKTSPAHLIIRTSLAEAVLQPTIKRLISEIDPLQPLTHFSSLQSDVAKSVAPRRFNSLLVNSFAALALLLAMIGLYGVMAHAVIARTRELGIRTALGAQSQNLLRLVLRQGMSLVALGVGVGAICSLALSRAVSSLLYNVPAQDPVIFIGAPIVLAVVALLACYIPARRATMVSPMTALRQD